MKANAFVIYAHRLRDDAMDVIKSQFMQGSFVVMICSNHFEPVRELIHSIKI